MRERFAAIVRFQTRPQTLLIAFAFLATGVVPFNFGGLELWGLLGLVALSVLATVVALFQPLQHNDVPQWRNPTVWYVGFLALIALSFAFTKAPVITADHALLAFLGFLLFFAYRILGERIDRERLFLALILAGTVITVWSLWRYVDMGTVSRILGPFRNPDGLGPALLVPLALAVGWLRSRSGRGRILPGIVAALLLFAFALTACVAALLGILGALVLGWLVLRPRIRPRTVGLVLVGVAVLAGALFVTRALLLDTSDITAITAFPRNAAAGSFRFRTEYALTSLRMTNAHPWTGVGFGTWADHATLHQRDLGERSARAHGLLPQYLGELGYPGGLAFLGLLATTLILVWRSVRSGTPFEKAGAVGATALAFAACIDIGWLYPSNIALFWIVAGALVVPSTVRMTQARLQRFYRVTLAVFASATLLYQAARWTSTYLEQEANKAAGKKDWYGMVANASLAMRFLPNPVQETALAYLYYQNGRGEERTVMKEWAERALRHNPQASQTYVLLDRIAVENKDLVAAERFMRDGLAVDPHFTPELAIDLARLLLDAQRNAEARDIASTMIANIGAVPNAGPAMSLLAYQAAIAEVRLGDRNAALAHLDFAIAKDPENTDAAAFRTANFPDRP